MIIDQTDISNPSSNGLQAQLEPVHELVLQRIRLRAKRRIVWLRMLWQQTSTKGESTHNLHTEVDGYLENFDAPKAEAAWQAEDEEIQPLNRKIGEVEKAMKTHPSSRLELLERLFGLSTKECDLLQVCFAISMEPNLARIYAYLQDHAAKGYVTEAMAARLFGHGRSLMLAAESPLKTWGLVFEKETGKGEPPLYECDPHIRNWLLGMNDLDEVLTGISRIQPVLEPLKCWKAAKTDRIVLKILEQAPQQRLRVCIAGVQGSGRHSFAAWVASRLDMPLLSLDSKRVPENRLQQVFIHAQRLAILNGWALAWTSDELLRNFGNYPWLPFHLQFIICEPGQFPAPIEGMVDYHLEMPSLSIEDRRQLWKAYVPGSIAWGEEGLNKLVTCYQSSVGQIAAAKQRGVGSAGEAASLMRTSTRHLLGSLAQWMECPFDWDDLVAPEWLRRNLDDFLFEASERTLFWEQPTARRLFPQGRGLIGLFFGPPGTGKTMAAQVIAAKLGLDLFRIDMSTVVSKYVGETSKNLERILSRAHSMNAVLLFDEADALFGKRTEVRDAHDRYANTDTNYLLQAIENYPGLAILSSNKKGNIDNGFIRRLRYVLEFPRPDAVQRLQIWQRIIGELGPQERLKALEGKLPRLAEAVDLTGAQIKYAILSALFIARQEKQELAIPHLLRGIERELMKEGRGVSRQLVDMFKN